MGALLRVKRSSALIAIVLLSVGVGACGGGGTGKSVSSLSQASPRQVPAASTSTTSAAQRLREGENSELKTRGHPASEPDRREIVALVKRYYRAAAADDGMTACSLLTSPLEKSVAEDYGNDTGLPYMHGKTCAVVMSKLFRHPPHMSVADLDSTTVIGARVNGSDGFAEIRSTTIRLGEMNVRREGGAWKIDVLIGSVN